MTKPDLMRFLWEYRQLRFRDPRVYRHMLLQELKHMEILPWPIRWLAGFYWWWL